MKEPSCSWIGGSGLDCELGRSGWTDGKGSAALEQPAPTSILLLQGFLFFGTEVIISSVSAVSRSTVETHMQITDTSCKGACLWLLSSAWVTQQKWDFTSDKICYNHSSSVFSGVVSLQWGTCGHFPITESPFQPTSLLFIHQIMDLFWLFSRARASNTLEVRVCASLCGWMCGGREGRGLIRIKQK